MSITPQPMAPVVPIPITAYAACNGMGRSVQEISDSLFASRRGLTPCPLEVPFETLCGIVPGELPPMPSGREDYESRVVRIALLAYAQIHESVQQAIARWGARRVGMVVGTSTGGIGETETAYDHFIRHGRAPDGYDFARQHSFCAFADVLREQSGIEGPRYVVSTACSSSGKVFGSAQRLMQMDVVDAVLVGGVDAVCLTTVRGFHSLGVMASGPSRPFGAERPGMNIGEGGALLLLERDGKALARCTGVGETSDAFHMSAPDPEGRGAQAAMRRALQQAGLEPSAIDHVNAHGTGTQANDIGEARAISSVLGNAVPVASTKGYTGHTLAAAGATEAILAIECMRRSFLPKSVGAAPADAAVEINLVHERIEQPLRRVISNSFAFGGNNVSVVLEAGP